MDLPTLSQTAIWRRVIENGKIKAEKIKHFLQNEKTFASTSMVNELAKKNMK